MYNLKAKDVDMIRFIGKDVVSKFNKWKDLNDNVTILDVKFEVGVNGGSIGFHSEEILLVIYSDK